MALKISKVSWMRKLWDYEKNLGEFGKTAKDILCNSSNNYYWLCPKTCPRNCPHSWIQTPREVYATNMGCPFKGCRDQPKKNCIHDMLSFTHPKLADEWCYEQNGNLKPEDVTYGSSKRAWWKCPNICNGCGDLHIYSATINKRIIGRGCPYCHNGSNSAKPHCFEMSTAGLHPNLMKEWHPTKNKKLDPSEILPGSNVKIWWRCRKSRFSCDCIHEWEASLSSRTRLMSNCPFCSILKQQVCIHNSLAYLRKNLMLEWDYEKNKRLGLDPETISIGSDIVASWICLKNPNHKFYLPVNHRARRNYGCSTCSHKSESKFYDWLLETYPNNKILKQIFFDWCLSKFTNSKLFFDFVLDDINLIIEVDGRQHFEVVSNWKSPMANQIVDFYKMEQALANGYSIIRIFQEDIYNDKNDWQDKIKEAISSFQTKKSEVQKHSIIYIGSNDQYKEYSEYFQAIQKYKASIIPKTKKQKEEEKAKNREIIKKIISCRLYDDIDDV